MRCRSAKGTDVPVHLLAALAVHGIKAEVLRFGHGREEARLHGLGAALQRRGDLGVPLRRVRFEALGRRGLVGLAARLVESELDDRNIGVARVKEVVERGLRQVQLDLVQRFERVAEVDEDQIALVAQFRERVRSAPAHRDWLAPVRSACVGLGGDPFAVRGGGAPRLPVEAEELVQDTASLQA